MKKDIHPEYNEVTVVLTNGDSFKTKSCYNKADKTIKLDVDPFNHPAWKVTSSNFVNTKNNQVAKFNTKFGNAFSAKKAK